MSGRDLVEQKLMQMPPEGAWPSVVMGELVAMADDGHTALVLFTGQHGTAAVRARAVVDLHGSHIGRRVALMFENGDVDWPIVMGVLRGAAGWPLDERPGQVELDADGERLVISAREQVVLRCGKASVTLTRAGKVVIRGSQVLSRSTGVNRLKGGAVLIN